MRQETALDLFNRIVESEGSGLEDEEDLVRLCDSYVCAESNVHRMAIGTFTPSVIAEFLIDIVGVSHQAVDKRFIGYMSGCLYDAAETHRIRKLNGNEYGNVRLVLRDEIDLQTYSVEDRWEDEE